jgi:hypothetical protein
MARADAATSQQTNADRAVATYNALQRYFRVPGTSLYRETSPWTGGNAYSYLWPFSRALVGTLALAGVPSRLVGGASYMSAVQDCLNGLTQYWDAAANPPAYDSYVVSAGGGDKFYDDNAWVALALVEHHRMGLDATGSSLTLADRLFSFAASGWDQLASDPHPGGVFWVQQGAGLGLTNHDRGAGLNAGNAKLGFNLHDLTGLAAYSGDGAVVAAAGSLGATNMFNWVNHYLDSTRTGTGLYWNAVRRDGSIDTNFWTYTQGEMIGANVLRYRLTGNSVYLQQAQGIASKTLSSFRTFIGQPPSFNAMCFHDMLRLYAVASDASLQAKMLETMQSYADWAWRNAAARDPKTNLFYFTDAGQPAAGSGQPAQLRDQGAMLQLYALLAWNSWD